MPLGTVIVMVPFAAASAPVALVVACMIQSEVVAPSSVDDEIPTFDTDVVGVSKFSPGVAEFGGSAIVETVKSEVLE